MELETMIMNGKCSTANPYLQEAVVEIKHALADKSDNLFEIIITFCQDDDAKLE